MPLPAELCDFSQADLDRARAIGAIYRGAAVIVIHEPVLEEIIEYSEQGRRCEVGGFLLGSVYSDDPPFTVIRHFHPALQAVSGAASLTLRTRRGPTFTARPSRSTPARPSSAGTTRTRGSASSCRATICSSTATFSPKSGRWPWSSIRSGRNSGSSSGEKGK